jgi:hypothetical protein
MPVARPQGCDIFMPAIVKRASISWTEVFKRTWKEANEDEVLGQKVKRP